MDAKKRQKPAAGSVGRTSVPMNLIKYLTVCAAIAAFCTFGEVHRAAAQGDSGQETKSQQKLDIAAARADRKALIGANMNLTKDQAAAFWPIYDAYQARMDKLDERHVAELKAFVEHYETLTDADATKKLDEVIAIRQTRLDVQKEFIPKFRAAVSSILTTRFFQIDNKLETMIQYNISQTLPLAQPTPANE